MHANYSSHSGSGDIVIGNKIILPSNLTAENLYPIAEEIFKKLRDNDFIAAKTIIATINKLPATYIARQVVNMLDTVIEFCKDNNSLTTGSPYFSLAKDDELPENIKDIVFASIILIEHKTKTPEQLRELFIQSPRKKHTHLFFLQFIATQVELTDYWRAHEVLLGEDELYCLSRGACRENDLILAGLAAGQLNKNYPTINNFAFCSYIQVIELVEKHKNKDIFSFDKDVFDEIQRHIENTLELIDTHQDNRYLICTLANLVLLVRGNNSKLIQKAIEYRNLVLKISPDVLNFIDSIVSYSGGNITDRLKGIDVSNELTSVELIIILEAIDRGLYIKEILRSKVFAMELNDENSNNEIEFNFQLILLKAKLLKNEKNNIIEKNKIKNHLQRTQTVSDISRVSSLAIINLCNALLSIGLANESCSFLETHLPEKLWPSPLVLTYFESLICAEKLSTLAINLEKLEKEQWDHQVWLYQAKLYLTEHKWVESQAALEEALKLAPNFADAWSLLIQYTLKINPQSAQALLEKIPQETFLYLNSSTYSLLFTIARLVDRQYSEKIMAEFFIKDPKRYASELLRLHFSTLVEDSTKKREQRNSYPIHNVVRAIKLRRDDKTQEILIVDIEPNSEQDILLSIHTAYGEQLANLPVGGKIYHVMEQLEIIEEADPYQVIFRHALDIANKRPDETFPMKAIYIPSEPEKMLDKLKSELSKFTHSDRTAFILNCENVPLYIKGYELHPNNPVKAAIQLLESPIINKTLLLPAGNVDVFDEFVTDVYGLIYLALIKADVAVQNSGVKIHITTETYNCISSWLKEIKNPNYLSIGLIDDQLYRVTSKDIKKSTGSICDSLSKLLEFCEIKAVPVQDTPLLLNDIKDFFDASVYSTMKYAVFTSVPYFILDDFTSIVLINIQNSLAIVKASFFIARLLQSMKISDKFEGYTRHILTYLPIPITYSDTIALAQSKQDKYIKLAIDILKRHHASSIDFDSLCSLLAIIIIRPLVLIYINEVVLKKNSILNDKASLLFNMCCQFVVSKSDGRTAEERIVDFTQRITANSILSKQYIIYIYDMVSTFSMGYFLDVDYMNSLIKPEPMPIPEETS